MKIAALLLAITMVASTGAARRVETATFRFIDATQESGLGGFRHTSGNPRDKRYIIEVISGGVALFDYNNDRLIDIYLVNGSRLDVLRGKAKPEPAERSQLYQNTGGGRFKDVTERAGVDNLGRWGMGACAADYDNDGDKDLFVTNAFGRNRLYRNNGDGTFTDATQKAAVGGDERHWSTGAAWADYDGDGYADLFVAGYVDLDLNNLPDPGTNQYCRYRGMPVNCGPRGLKGARDYLYRNNGDGTFTETSARAGVDDKAGYYGLGCVWADFDDDGRIDLYVGNDSTPNYLYKNLGDGRFKEVGSESGTAVNEDGREQAAMGVDAADYDGDARLDIFVTNFADDYSTLYRNLGQMRFEDVSSRAGLAAPVWNFLKWGTSFIDFDNDGWLDLFIANGHIYPEVENKGFGQSYAQRNQLFKNNGDGRFSEVREGALEKIIHVSRGAAFGDLDNDGRVDVVVNNLDDRPTLLLNRSASGNHVSFSLSSRASNRDAIGARVTIVAGGRKQTATVKAGHSYLSQSDLRLHFGIGEAARVDAVEIRWPRGAVERLTGVAANRVVAVEEKAAR